MRTDNNAAALNDSRFSCLNDDTGLKPIPAPVQPDALQQINERHNPSNNLVIQFFVLSFSLLEHASTKAKAFWRSTLGKCAWVPPATGEEWSVNIKVWVNVPGGYSTMQRGEYEQEGLSELWADDSEMGRHSPGSERVIARAHARRVHCPVEISTITAYPLSALSFHPFAFRGALRQRMQPLFPLVGDGLFDAIIFHAATSPTLLSPISSYSTLGFCGRRGRNQAVGGDGVDGWIGCTSGRPPA
ncbi:hypothetical protein DFH08DRAFT_942020 [Mycena albidolilacea]|uniref:Uncharacterized protein n=1 Tax=Mycena albidolilacea TaxID=1033008 RepID=A0AAD6ZGS0_9AGAR|nr:hypothetical protein DFH08DRAFT_942020 [Mycena albidolilacea]